MSRGFQVSSCPLSRVLASISGWSVGTFMEVAVLLEPMRDGVRSGVPMKKASAPSARQARATTLVNIILWLWERERGEKDEERVEGVLCLRGYVGSGARSSTSYNTCPYHAGSDPTYDAPWCA